MGYKQIQENIINTLSYSDIFDYPLTSFELWKYYIGKKVSKDDFYLSLSFLFSLKQGNYYSLPNRRKLNHVRAQRQKESKRKIEKVTRFIHLLSFIPTIQLIGISGSVALLNADQEDDIDLFFITKKDTLWLTRLVVTLILSVAGIKRKVGATCAKDTICPNMFMAQDNLAFDKNSQNLFVAHEIGQVKVMINKNNTYEHFLQENKWVVRFLPNVLPVFKNMPVVYKKKNNYWLKVLNKCAYVLQHLYMFSKQTREVVQEDRAAFHPLNRKEKILGEYRKKSKENMRTFEEQINMRKIELQHAVLASN